MSVSDDNEAETSRINGTRNRKLRSARHACTPSLPARGRRYRPWPWRTRGSCAAWSAAVGLEESTLRLGARHNLDRQQYEEEADYGLERARGRRHAHVPYGRERSVHVSVDDVGGRVELGRVARELVEEPEVRVEDPADREQHVDDDQRLEERQRYMPHLLPRVGTVQAGRLVVLGVDRDHPGQIDDAPEPTVLPNGDEGEDYRPVLRRLVPVDGVTAKRNQRVVDEAVAGVEEGEDEVVDDHVREEIGEEQGRLVEPRDPAVRTLHLLQQKGDAERHHQDADDEERVHEEGVEDDPPRVVGLKEVVEVLEADPAAAQDALVGAVVLERDDDPEHREVGEDEKDDQPRRHHQQEGAVSFHQSSRAT